MTIPANLYDLQSMEAVLTGRGDAVADLYACSCCHRTGPANAFASTEGLPGILPAFVCWTCASGPHRQACAEQAAAEVAAAGPDWSAVRAQRDLLLSRCDWTQLPDAPLDDDARAAWSVYRTALRNLTDTFATPSAVVWPDSPT